jgi:hypothetical protein
MGGGKAKNRQMIDIQGEIMIGLAAQGSTAVTPMQCFQPATTC